MRKFTKYPSNCIKASSDYPHNIYLIDIGELLTQDDAEFDAYNQVYNKQYGYYDTNQYYRDCTFEEAKSEVYNYVTRVGNGTYGIISSTAIDDEILEDLAANGESVEDLPVEDETYLVQDVLYSVAVINGELVENFIK